MPKILYVLLPLAVLAIVAAYFLLAGDNQPQEPVGVSQATPEEAWPIIKAGGNVVLLDVRTPEEFNQQHVPGSRLLPLAPPPEFTAEAHRLLPDKNTAIYVICRSGRRSQIAAEILAADGYKKVSNLGGIIDWPYETTSSE